MSNSVPSEVSIAALRSSTAFSLRTSLPMGFLVLVDADIALSRFSVGRSGRRG